LGDGGFDVAAGSREFVGHAFLGGFDFVGGPGASGFEQCGALVEKFFSGGLLLGVDPCAGLPQGILVLLNLFCCRSLSGLGGSLRADGARLALGHNLQERLEEKGAKNQVKSEDSQDCGHSLEEEFAQLVNNFLHLSCVACTQVGSHAMPLPGKGVTVGLKLPRETVFYSIRRSFPSNVA
jgi:hypothetical protein